MSRSYLKLMKMADFAKSLASLSTCKRTGVGCVIFAPDFSAVHAIGYNGPPVGQPNDSCTGERGACGCTHAEANALVKRRPGDRGIMLCTKMPCLPCSSLIVNSRAIGSVLFIEDCSAPGSAILLGAGVGLLRVDQLKEDDSFFRWLQEEARR